MDNDELVLYLTNGAEGDGFLLSRRDEEPCELSPRLVRVILSLHMALREDEDLPMGMRGWRSKTWIVEKMSSLVEKGYLIEPASLVHYVSDINGLSPGLIEGGRNRGYRLGRHITVLER